MPNITVNIVGGTQQENTSAVTIGNVRWGLNGTANFGQPQNVPNGNQKLTVYKTTEPREIIGYVEVRGVDTTLNITVNNDSIIVEEA
ncbi:hypothetical protein [Tenacibaculum sp. M341]|uniref:hypothetical protein n=1 Tax=Tenacibaculum sp. M341 TaxID=2530339 RepID=UPI001A9D9959|nr:hypothetical protein [Tenacibaculum sp. M341]